MMRIRRHHPGQLTLDWSKDAEIERIIEARVAIRCEAAALRWRFRLILIESVLMGTLVLGAGFALRQPADRILRSAAMVSGACLVSGLLLIALAGFSGYLVARFRRWRGQ